MPISKLKQYRFWNTQVLPISLAQQMKNNIKIEFDALFFVYSEHIISSQLWFSKKKKKNSQLCKTKSFCIFSITEGKRKKKTMKLLFFILVYLFFIFLFHT